MCKLIFVALFTTAKDVNNEIFINLNKLGYTYSEVLQSLKRSKE